LILALCSPDSDKFETVATVLPENVDTAGGVTATILPKALKPTILSIPGFPRPLRTYSEDYTVTESENDLKGLTLRAEKNICIGSLILDERALIMIPARLKANLKLPPEATAEEHQIALNKFTEEVLQTVCLQKMEPTARHRLLSLQNACETDEDGVGPFLGRVKTNALHVSALGLKLEDSELADERYYAVCPTISRVNHRSGYW